ncbi:MAG TPA: histidine phosphatase family protein [Pseudonocardia sp.]|nr:histidine phosphatase family protein [Pseudonocardia sp.]
MKLILARHGRTEGNVIKALDSRPPGMPLDEVGRAQAEDLAGRLAATPVAAVYASRATRAQQTAAPVAAAHDLPVVVLDGVQEADCGELEGATDPASHERFQDVYEAWLNEEFDARLPGGESALEVRARFVAAVEAVAGADPVVVVSHGAAIRLGVGALLGEGAETRYVPNAGLVVLTGTPGRWALEHWDGAEPVPGDVTGGGDVIGW